jgi:hypothetical protein
MTGGPSTPASQPPWEVDEAWSVFTATLEESGLRHAFKLGSQPRPGPSSGRAAFGDHVTALLQGWLSSSAIDESQPESFRVVVATAPGQPPRLAFFARPMPEGCLRVPQGELVQRVLREVFDVEAGHPVAVARYHVDLLEGEADGVGSRLSGVAVIDTEDTRRIVEAFLQHVLRRRREDFPIEQGHTLQISYLSDETVGITFPQRRVPVAPEILDRLPNLWDATVADLRARLASETSS